MNKLELQKVANEVRKGIITGVHAAKAGHPGGSLSAADLFTYLYFEEMNVDPKNPQDPVPFPPSNAKNSPLFKEKLSPFTTSGSSLS